MTTMDRTLATRRMDDAAADLERIGREIGARRQEIAAHEERIAALEALRARTLGHLDILVELYGDTGDGNADGDQGDGDEADERAMTTGEAPAFAVADTPDGALSDDTARALLASAASPAGGGGLPVRRSRRSRR